MRAFAIVLSLGVVGVAHAEPWRCGMPDRLPDLVRRAPPVHVELAFDAAGPPQVRDAFGTFDGVKTSAHFAVKWGPDAASDDGKADAILAALETGWREYVDELGHRVPLGAPEFLVNVYLGSTGGAAPEIDFAGGYVTLDDEGYPYIVLSPDLEIGEAIDAVSVHELYHVFQVSLPAYAASWRAAWFFEATAEWAAQEVYPDLAQVYGFVGAFLIRPDLSLDFFENPFEGLGRQYGAFAFPRFVTETLSSARLVRDAWETADEDDDPIDVIAGLLAAEELSFDDAFADFAATHAVGDHAHGAVYREWANLYAAAFPDEAHSISFVLPSAPEDSWTAAPAALAPQAYGYDVVELRPSQRGRFAVSFDGDAAGSLGTPARFRAILVEDAAPPRYTPLALDADAAGTVELTVGRSGGRRLLVVVAEPTARLEGERFGFAAQLVRLPEPDRPPGEPDGGCAVGGRRTPPGGWLLVLLGLAISVGARARSRASAPTRGR